MVQGQESSGAGATGDAVEAAVWMHRFLADLAVVRSANTVRAYQHDLSRWADFCRVAAVDPLRARPRDVVAFIRHEHARSARAAGTIGARTLVRRLSAIRQWYTYLTLEPEVTGVQRNPVLGGSALRTASGSVAGRPALLRYDCPQPEVLSPTEIDGFIAHLTATCYRDRAIVWLLKDGGMRIGEALALRLGDIHWAGRRVTVRAPRRTTSAPSP